MRSHLNMRPTRNNPYGILLLAIPFVVGGLVLLFHHGPLIVPAYSAGSIRAPDANGFVVETASISMQRVAGIFGFVVAGIIVRLYFRVRNIGKGE